MDPEEALWLTFAKDAILATFQSRASVWQALQAGALAGLPIATVAAMADQITFAQMWPLPGASLGVAGLCALALYANRWLMERDMKALLARIKRLKPPGG